ncbi:MAG: alpha/beta fold hydrolase [Pseudomonadota bacterium]
MPNRRFRRSASVAVACSALVGCASNPTILFDSAGSVLDAGAGEETILFATVRAAAADSQMVFGAARSQEMSYGAVTVRIPPQREPGDISYPSDRVNPARDFIASRIDFLSSGDALKASVEARLADRPLRDRSVSLFVHGYNTDFAEGVFLNAQMVHDFRAPGVPVHFSWASAGVPQGYLYDLESANIARDDLAATIRMLEGTSASDVILVAHSMGAMVLMEALREIGLEGDQDTLSRISTVVLAAPDIDIDVFEEQLAAIEPRPFPLLVFVSRRDPALRVSSRLRGRAPRVGDGSAIDRLAGLGVDVVDLTDIEGSRRDEHTKFASSPFVINMIRQAETVRASLDAAPEDPIALLDAVNPGAAQVAVIAAE